MSEPRLKPDLEFLELLELGPAPAEADHPAGKPKGPTSEAARLVAERERRIEHNVTSYTEGHSSGKGEGMAQVLAATLEGQSVPAIVAECRRTHPRVVDELRIRGFTVCADGSIVITEAVLPEHRQPLEPSHD
jgi:hypothetical protein